jgi:cyclophilin family peptidyl-prolyl cis-trans isomerase
VAHLTGQFTIFGEVLTGSEVLASILEGERLISVKVDER